MHRPLGWLATLLEAVNGSATRLASLCAGSSEEASYLPPAVLNLTAEEEVCGFHESAGRVRR